MPEAPDVLPTTYEPSDIEAPLFAFWLEAGYFSREAAGFADFAKAPHTIVIPPPNVTGVLHMGHALNNTLQDILTRRARMQGRPTRWIVGTDHAGIATQNKVEQKLASEGLTRFDLGREAFVAACWDWRKTYGSTIIEQLKGMGCSCDYAQEHFTMDLDYAKAIRRVFVDWYREGLIYRGLRIINWCPRCTTALADDEVEHVEETGHLWHLRYPLVEPVGGFEYLVVATTRPETMLGDTGVAVNPDDARYRALVEAGAQVRLPLMDRVIPVFADDYVDRNFGTGVVKVTPAHDPNDFEMGMRHNLEQINILTEQAYINTNGGRFAGLSREQAREAVVAALDELGLLERVEEHDHAVGHCYRCATTIEPWASEQWFVAMKGLAAPAIEAVRDGRVAFHPQRWENIYFHWMENIRDWCISRQLWWGHRIPVFYCDSCGWIDALEEDATVCPICGAALRQDEDVLDTWFSSQLWPFVTQGWPGDVASGASSETLAAWPELAAYYPTQVLSTARDIIFLWVARMVMSSMYCLSGTVPFTDVIIHPTVLDKYGNIMSKSRGNGIDPMELIAEYGADAMRFGLAIQVTGAQDLKFDKEKLGVYRNFATKIWNAARFVLMNLEGAAEGATEEVAEGVAAGAAEGVAAVTAEGATDAGATDAGVAADAVPRADAGAVSQRVTPQAYSAADRWILSRLARLTHVLNNEHADFDFGSSARALYAFFWNEFCDWYIELAKGQLTQGDEPRAAVRRNLVFVLDTALRLLHPMMPFVTDRIWRTLPHGDERPSLMVAAWPDPDVLSAYIDEEAERSIELLCAVVTTVRAVRASYGISPRQELDVVVRTGGQRAADDTRALKAQAAQLRRMAKIAHFAVAPDASKPPQSSVNIIQGLEVYVVLEGLIDFAVERARLTRKREKAAGDWERLSKKLANEGFLAKAAPEVVEKTRADAAELEAELAQIDEQLASFA
ncbi:MAG: valine--tRNA ligase [Coriobacteriales bacterium]|nr:valine--tRNA ligase [Coriobacteriales bacterium]